MKIITGKVHSALKCVVYGVEGVGKSTFATHFPSPLFSDTEGGTKSLDVARLPRPLSWSALLDQAKYVRDSHHAYQTYVIDTADWAEQLCVTHVTSKSKVSGIEDFGYGKGYVYLAEEFSRLLNLLDEIVERGINVLVLAHAIVRTINPPDALESYDRWELKLSKKSAPLLKEWADLLLFANYKVDVIKDTSGKRKATGAKRVMYTEHSASYDAKNRFGLPPELPFDYDQIANILDGTGTPTKPQLSEQMVTTPAPNPIAMPLLSSSPSGIPTELMELMSNHNVTADEIQFAVAVKGYFPQDMPISDYPKDFTLGCLVAGWQHVYEAIKENRAQLPREWK